MSSRRDALRAELLTAFSGTADGTPPWVLELRDGDDEGFFAPGGAAWTVHAEMSTLVAGIRALLMQALHPGAMAGVHDWSRYRKDPLGRLIGTVRWIVVTTYGSKDQARRETDRVMRFHARVKGEYDDNAGARKAYTAADQDLVSWVHLAFADAFLGSHLEWGGRIPGGADAYVAEWATAGTLMGVESPPRSEAELREQLASYLPQLRRDERVDDVVTFIRNPPLSPRLRRAYGLLFAGAVASMPVEFRRLLGLRRSPLPVKLLTGLALRQAGRALRSSGEMSSPDFAMERVARLRARSRA
jgi:uncharacterized protein (DUF2236 family)